MKYIKNFFILAPILLLAVFVMGGVPNKAQAASHVSVASCTDFKNMSLGGTYLLTTDLDCISEGNSVMVASSTAPFTGTFDGGGYTITVAINILENDPADDLDNNVGLFSTISGGTVTNLRVAGSIESTGSKVGEIVGQAINGSTISKVANTANVTGVWYYICNESRWEHAVAVT